MNKTIVLWSDEAVGRLIKFVVEYSIDGNMLHVLQLTPTEFSLVDIASSTIRKKVFVHSKHGQALLRNRFMKAGMLKDLVVRIAEKHDLTVVAHHD